MQPCRLVDPVGKPYPQQISQPDKDRSEEDQVIQGDMGYIWIQVS